MMMMMRWWWWWYDDDNDDDGDDDDDDGDDGGGDDDDDDDDDDDEMMMMTMTTIMMAYICSFLSKIEESRITSKVGATDKPAYEYVYPVLLFANFSDDMINYSFYCFITS